MQTKGTIIEVLPVKTGTSADGKEWKKITLINHIASCCRINFIMF